MKCSPCLCIPLDKGVFVMGHFRRGIALFFCALFLVILLTVLEFEIKAGFIEGTYDGKILLLKLTGFSFVHGVLAQFMIEAAKDRKTGEKKNCQIFLGLAFIVAVSQIIYLIVDAVNSEEEWSDWGYRFCYIASAIIGYSFYEIVVYFFMKDIGNSRVQNTSAGGEPEIQYIPETPMYPQQQYHS